MKILKFFILFILTGICLNNQAMAQDRQKIDSLKQEAKLHYQDYKKYAYVMSDLAYEYYFSYPDSAIYFASLVLPRTIEYKDTNDLGYFYTFIGVCYKNSGEYDSAITYLEKSIVFQTLADFPSAVAGSHNNLGNVYKLKGNYEKGVYHFLQSIKLFEALNNTENLGEVHSNLGELYVELEEYELAKEHFYKSQNYYKKSGNKASFAWVCSDLGLLKTRLNETDSALYYYQRAADIWMDLDRMKDYGSCLMEMAQIKFETGQDVEALNLFERAETEFTKLNYHYGLSEVYLYEGRYYAKHGRYNKAIEKFNASLERSDYLRANGLIVEVYAELYKASKLLGQTKNALSYLEKYQELKDSVFGIEQDKVRLEFQTQYDVLNKENQIQQLQDSARIQYLVNEQSRLENEKNKLANQQQKAGIYVLILGIVMALIITILLYRRNKVKTKLNHELAKSLKEREALLKEVHHRVKNNLQIVSSLLNLQAGYVSQKSAQEILKESQDRIASMTLIHENLYKSDHLNNIKFKDYVHNLVDNLELSFDLKGKNVLIDVDVEDFNLDMDYLVPCGLILNELITNSIKYAFTQGGEGQIKISSGLTKDGWCRIQFSDNGSGFSEGIDLKNTSSLGLRLVQGLVRQLKGEINFLNPEKGVSIDIKFNTYGK